MIKIGVTGHRILAELNKINAGIEKALRYIEKSFPNHNLAVISSLAEGADRLAAIGVLQRPDATLIVPLPLPQADYETDFETAESKDEFQELIKCSSEVIEMPATSTRIEAYEAAGNYVLENCDVLLTIWNGQAAQGQGGTGEIVALARERKMPIVWIHAGNRKPGKQEPTSLGDEQGKVTFENFQM